MLDHSFPFGTLIRLWMILFLAVPALAADQRDYKVTVSGLHTVTGWPQQQFPTGMSYDGTEMDTFPPDRACIQQQLRELDAALTLLKNDSVAHAKTLESVQIDLQYADLPKDKRSARVDESYWAKIPIPLSEGLSHKVHLRSRLHLAPIMPNTRKDKDPMRCVPVRADTIRSAFQAPDTDFSDFAQFIEAEKGLRADPLTGGFLQAFEGAYSELEQKCGVNRYSKAQLTDKQKRCLDSRARLKEGTSRRPMPDSAIQGERQSKGLSGGVTDSSGQAAEAARGAVGSGH